MPRPGGVGQLSQCQNSITGDKAYSSRANRQALQDKRIRETIPQPNDQIANRQRRGSRGGRPPAFDPMGYRRCNQFERGFNRRKHWRGLAPDSTNSAATTKPPSTWSKCSTGYAPSPTDMIRGTEPRPQSRLSWLATEMQRRAVRLIADMPLGPAACAWRSKAPSCSDSLQLHLGLRALCFLSMLRTCRIRIMSCEWRHSPGERPCPPKAFSSANESPPTGRRACKAPACMISQGIDNGIALSGLNRVMPAQQLGQFQSQILRPLELARLTSLTISSVRRALPLRPTQKA